MALPAPPFYLNPIPNNSFYSVPVYTVCGPYYPLTVGAGLNVDPLTAILTSTGGGGGGGVTSLTAGPGIGINTSVGAVTICNTGVTSIVAGANIAISQIGTVVTVAGTKAGTVTSIATGTGLTGGPITSTGTIALANTGVTAGAYTYAAITVDAQGRLTSAASGAAPVSATSFLAKGDMLVGTGPNTFAILPSSGTVGDILCVNPATATGLQWGAHTGILCGYTCNAAPSNTALGCGAATTATGVYNTALGFTAAQNLTTGAYNTILGAGAMTDPASCNTIVGTEAASFATGGCLVAIGAGVRVPKPGDDFQMAIGIGSCRWLTGCNTLAIQPGAGIIDRTNGCGSVDMVLTSQGNAIEWKTASSVLSAPNYGNFLHTVTQSPILVGVGQPVLLNTTVAANNFFISGGSRIQAQVADVYNLQFSLQLLLTTGGGDNVEVWLVKNGVAVPNSNTSFSIKNQNEAEFVALNFVESLNIGDYLQLYWAAGDIHINLQALASQFGGPAIPSAIVTIVPVGA